MRHARLSTDLFRNVSRIARSGRALLGVAVLTTLAACGDIVAPAPRLSPKSADPLLVGADTTNLAEQFSDPVYYHARADARGLNNLGQATGARLVHPTDFDFRPYRWTPGSGFVRLSGHCCGTASGEDINDAGVIVGRGQINQSIGLRAFVTTGDAMVNLGLLPGAASDGSSFAVAVNNAGQVVGESDDAGYRRRAVLWSPSGVIQDLGTLGGVRSTAIDINASGHVIGMSEVSDGGARHAFLWSPGAGMQDLTVMLGAVTNVTAINDAGQIAGTFTTPSGASHAFLYTPGSGLRDLGTLGGTTSTATGLNNKGDVVGSSTLAGGASHAFLWSVSEGMEDITAITGYNRVRRLNDKMQTLIGHEQFAGLPSIVSLKVIDRASQSISFTSAPPASAMVGGSFTVSATATSGLAVAFSSLTPSVCSVSGSTTSFSATGSCVVAAAQSGNGSYFPAPQVTQTITVKPAIAAWPFAGFDKPIDNAPAYNKTKAGSMVALKFSLGGNRGLALFAAGSPTSVNVSCSTGAPIGASEVVSPAALDLKYQSGPDRYTLRWQTSGSWAGRCRALRLALVDGSTHTALFSFR